MALTETSGSSGLGSHNNEQIDRSTLLIVSAGDHWSFKMSRQIDPLLRREQVRKTNETNPPKIAPVDIRVINARGKRNLRRLEGIVRREVNVEKKHSSLVGRFPRPHDRRAPVKQIIANRPGRARRRRILQSGVRREHYQRDQSVKQQRTRQKDDPKKRRHGWRAPRRSSRWQCGASVSATAAGATFFL
jgi:hypothetical protein